MAVDRELSPAEIVHAKMAGVPADRPGLLGEYPKMLYRKGTVEIGQHSLASDAIGGLSALPIAGHKEVATMTVETAEEELLALELGWHSTIAAAVAPAVSAKKAAA
jgi:hypothetical protein